MTIGAVACSLQGDSPDSNQIDAHKKCPSGSSSTQSSSSSSSGSTTSGGGGSSSTSTSAAAGGSTPLNGTPWNFTKCSSQRCIHEYASMTAINADDTLILTGTDSGFFVSKFPQGGALGGQTFGHQDFARWTDKPNEIVYRQGSQIHLADVNAGTSKLLIDPGIGSLNFGDEGDASEGLLAVRDAGSKTKGRVINLATGATCNDPSCLTCAAHIV
jgi:hypothetical protein